MLNKKKVDSKNVAVPITKAMLLRLARDGGWIKLTRWDREQGKLVTDLITADMPEDEIIL